MTKVYSEVFKGITIFSVNFPNIHLTVVAEDFFWVGCSYLGGLQDMPFFTAFSRKAEL